MNTALQHFNMAGRSVLITGGATGIGLAMTKALAGVGARVMMAARREDVIRKVADELNGQPGLGEVSWRGVDLFDRSSVRDLTAYASEVFGGVDVFIGNAGTDDVHVPIDALTDESIDRILRVNLTANIEITRDLLPHMRKQRWGRFVYCSSTASLVGSANDLMSVYGTAKSGINGFARYVAAETGRDGITANSLIVGLTLTEMMEAHLKSSAQLQHEFLVEAPAMTMAGRPAQPHELGGLIQLLVSDAGSYMTGGNIAVDGGLSTMLRPNAVVTAS